jgi:hypothetical protein
VRKRAQGAAVQLRGDMEKVVGGLVNVGAEGCIHAQVTARWSWCWGRRAQGPLVGLL